MRPSRKSSEAPEVVPDPRLHTPDKYIVHNENFLDFESPTNSLQLERRRQQQQQFLKLQQQGKLEDLVPDPHPGVDVFPPHPVFKPVFAPSSSGRTPTGYDPVPYGVRTSDGPRRMWGVWMVVLFVAIAFIIGGGVGGGLGGAIAVKEKAKVTDLQKQLASSSASTTTASPSPSSQATPIINLDPAGCPLIDNTTYNSTTPGYTFLQKCNLNIVAASSSTSVDAASSLQTTFSACMDACATYNKDTDPGGCLGVSWMMFNPTVPTQNFMCFLKNATTTTVAPESNQYVASAFLQGSVVTGV